MAKIDLERGRMMKAHHDGTHGEAFKRAQSNLAHWMIKHADDFFDAVEKLEAMKGGAGDE